MNKAVEEHIFIYQEVKYLQLEDAADYTGMNAPAIYQRIKRKDESVRYIQRNRSIFVNFEDCQKLAEYQQQKEKRLERKRKIELLFDLAENDDKALDLIVNTLKKNKKK